MGHHRSHAPPVAHARGRWIAPGRTQHGPEDGPVIDVPIPRSEGWHPSKCAVGPLRSPPPPTTTGAPDRPLGARP
eukprot:3277770-Alexandrium_andersonii.AAC.1